MNNKMPLLPLAQDLESKAVLKKCAKAHQALAELKGIVATIPNESILHSFPRSCVGMHMEPN